MAEFASVVDAVGSAVATQRAMLAFNHGTHSDRQIILRIGVNVVDIIIDGGDARTTRYRLRRIEMSASQSRISLKRRFTSSNC